MTSFTVPCLPAVSSNQSHGEYPDCRSERESGGEASLLVSPLVVAGIVIGLVLFLSCITIIIGSLFMSLSVCAGPDGFSYGGSLGELRSTCIEDFPPGLDFDSYRETLSQVNKLTVGFVMTVSKMLLSPVYKKLYLVRCANLAI
uniref:Brain expressed, associated with NEDD4, 1 n=1 Tax=Mastacembelus armatus TaxID=205130 RepID=A0A7N8X889_9TELE